MVGFSFELITKLFARSLFSVCFVVICVSYAHGQTCTVIDSSGGNFLVTIDGQTYLAVPIAVAKEALKAREEFSAALKRSKAADSLLTSYERINEAYEKHFELQTALMEQTQQLYVGYKELARDYKKIHGEAFLRFNGGIGALHDSDKDDYVPILLIGASAGRINAWAFLNDRDSGFIFGGNLPIRFGWPF